MTEQRSITCDGPACQEDLTWTGNSVAYRIAMADETIPTRWPCDTEHRKHRHIPDGTKHFCGTLCLRAWVLENVRVGDAAKSSEDVMDEAMDIYSDTLKRFADS